MVYLLDGSDSYGEQNEQIAHRRIVAGKGNPEESWAK